MMDSRSITEYKLIIEVCDEQECTKYDPFLLCYVDDCMSCPNARVKIIRQDDIIMRNDFKDGKNILRSDKINYFKRLFKREGIGFFEDVYGKKFNKFERCIMNIVFSILTK